MSHRTTAEPRSTDRVDNLHKIQEALKQGVRDALRLHKQAGNPVAIWQDGAVVWVTPENIPVDDEDPHEMK